MPIEVRPLSKKYRYWAVYKGHRILCSSRKMAEDKLNLLKKLYYSER